MSFFSKIVENKGAAIAVAGAVAVGALAWYFLHNLGYIKVITMKKGIMEMKNLITLILTNKYKNLGRL